jgi:hypothetical protein
MLHTFYYEMRIYDVEVCMWCAIRATGIIGPVFSEPVNSHRTMSRDTDM